MIDLYTMLLDTIYPAFGLTQVAEGEMDHQVAMVWLLHASLLDCSKYDVVKKLVDFIKSVPFRRKPWLSDDLPFAIASPFKKRNCCPFWENLFQRPTKYTVTVFLN